MKFFIFTCLVAAALAKHVSEQDYVMLRLPFRVTKRANLLLYVEVAGIGNSNSD